MNSQKIIVAISLEDETHKPLSKIRDMDISLDAEIHFVHVMQTTLYAKGMSLHTIAYPSAEERPRIEEKLIASMKDLKNELLPQHKNVSYKCLFSENSKACFTDYVEEEKADLVVVATRGRGHMKLFDSSFAQHQLKYSPTNVLVLR